MSEEFSLKALDSFKKEESLAVELLTSASENKRFSHAYIFVGKNTEKVMEFVKAFSKILLCDSGTSFDHCPSCKVFDSGQHPDFRIWTTEGEKSKVLKIEQVRELISENLRHPVTSNRKVLVLQDISQLNPAGSNAVLKTLEEPSSFTNIILTVDSLDNVLPTIISRCQIIPLKSSENITEESLNPEEYFPKSYKEASEKASAMAKTETADLIKFLKKLQVAVWQLSKESLPDNEESFNKKILLLEKLEKYMYSLDKYVNQKLVLENLFIDLAEARKFFWK